MERGDTGLGRDAYGLPGRERDRRGYGPGPYPSEDAYPASAEYKDDALGSGRPAEVEEADYGQLPGRPGEMPPPQQQQQQQFRQPGRPQPGKAFAGGSGGVVPPRHALAEGSGGGVPPGQQRRFPSGSPPNGGRPGNGVPHGQVPQGGVPRSGPPYSGQPHGGPPSSGPPSSGPPSSGPPSSGPPSSGPASSGPASSGPPNGGQMPGHQYRLPKGRRVPSGAERLNRPPGPAAPGGTSGRHHGPGPATQDRDGGSRRRHPQASAGPASGPAHGGPQAYAPPSVPGVSGPPPLHEHPAGPRLDGPDSRERLGPQLGPPTPSGPVIRQRETAIPEDRPGGAAQPVASIAPDDLEAFARDLRALRAKANLDYPEMAEVSHYEMKTLAAAAGGLRLPSLPVAVAFVRACDGDVAEWEGRWQKVAEKVTADAAKKRRHDGEENAELKEPADLPAALKPSARQPAAPPPADPDGGEVYVITSAKPRQPGWP